MTITDGALPPEAYWRVGDYCRTIETAWNDDERYRMIVRDLPRRFHSSSRDRQTYALGAAPRLTGTKWDVLLAAVAEHIAIIHNHRFPTGATSRSDSWTSLGCLPSWAAWTWPEVGSTRRGPSSDTACCPTHWT